MSYDSRPETFRHSLRVGQLLARSEVVFIDCETTGLDPERHEVWELALIFRAGEDWHEVEYQVPVDLTRADPTGLRVGRFYERRAAIEPLADNLAALCRVRHDGDKWVTGLTPSWHANKIAQILDGRHLVGAVPSFDAAFLSRWLTRYGQAATWHYHLIDVEALAAGFIVGRWSRSDEAEDQAVTLPWDSETLSLAVGIDPDRFERHTALGDARWAKAIYDVVMSE